MIKDRRWAAFDAHQKSQLVAYLLWLLLGLTGAHRFYLRMRPSGFGMLGLACFAAIMFFLSDLSGRMDEILVMAVGALSLLVIWVLVDVFRIPGFTRDYNDRLLHWLSGESEQWRKRKPMRPRAVPHKKRGIRF